MTGPFKLSDALRSAGRKIVAVPTVFTAAPAVKDAFEKTEDYEKLTAHEGHPVRYLPAHVHEQSQMPDDARDHEFEQASNLHELPLLR
jgi:hypothetical protein